MGRRPSSAESDSTRQVKATDDAASTAVAASAPSQQIAASDRLPASPDRTDAEAAQASSAEESEPPPSGEDRPRRFSRFLVFSALPSWLLSTMLHIVVVMLLALISLDPPPNTSLNILSVANGEAGQDIEQYQQSSGDPLLVEPIALESIPQAQAKAPVELQQIELAKELGSKPAPLNLNFSQETAPTTSSRGGVGGTTDAAMSFRSGDRRGEMLKGGGGTPDSEAAVAAALGWFVEHQLPDGSWSFDHRYGRCKGRCPDQGFLARARNGATAMALLPFLGAGETHKEGAYKEAVRKGLYFLTSNMRVTGERGDWSEEGSYMYSHGLASIAICEAYAMTHDKDLMRPAQLAINHIVYAQDPIGGGWRYFPQERGDTSVVGWMLMALKSGHLAYLHVPPETVRGASRFLDSVQLDGGAIYGYRSPDDRGPDTDRATTAVGLLCRMYLGWEREKPALQRGVRLTFGNGASAGQHVLRLLRHPSDAARRGGTLGEMESRDEGSPRR